MIRPGLVGFGLDEQVGVWRGPMPVVVVWVLWFMGGLAVGRWVWGDGGAWVSGWVVVGCVVGACVCGMGAWVFAKNRRAARVLVGAAVLCLGLAWWGLGQRGQAGLSLAGWVGAEGRLVVVDGEVVRRPRTRVARPGALGDRAFITPTTTMTVSADRLVSGAEPVSVSGRVLVMLPSADERWREGDRVRLTGWLERFESAANPGDIDFPRLMRQRGVVGRLKLKHPGNIEALDQPSGVVSWLRGKKAWLTDRASAALRVGISAEADPAAVGLIEAVLLGERGDALAEIDEAFRRTGLGHLLAISGLHLGILAAGLWAVALLVTGRPRLALAVTLGGVAIYALLIPARVPIVRATLMALGCGAALLGGRSVRAGPVLAAVAFLMLLWRPGDLFSAGFQLSFGVVAALLMFMRPVSWAIVKPSEAEAAGVTDAPWGRRVADFAAVNLVAWAVTIPLIAFHFQMVSPLGWFWTALALPAVAVVLWLGFVKMVVSLLLPWVGAWLAWPLVGLAEALVGAVTWAESAPGSWWYVPQPGVVWAVVTAGVIGAVLGGLFRRRRWAMAAAVAVCVVWLVWPSWRQRSVVPGVGPTTAAASVIDGEVGGEAALRCHMIAVGNGSAFLLQSAGETMMFDCGSASFHDPTNTTIGPALRALGITRVDTLVISHPDFDHFSGCVELIEQFGVRRVLVTQAFIDKAHENDRRAEAKVLRYLTDFGILRPDELEYDALRTVTAGWSERFGEATVTALWPRRGDDFKADNDGSIVLRFEVAGRSLLMCGDIQQVAMTAMLADPAIALDADVTDLPHHGSFVEAAPAWLARVSPEIVLQSCHRNRLDEDPWPIHLKNITRYVSARDGMTTVTIDRAGGVSAVTFRR